MTSKLNQIKKSCCTPARPIEDALVRPEVTARADREFASVEIEGGRSFLGTASPHFFDDGEGPLRKKTIKPFRIAPATVTNEEFATFIDETGYKTEAEEFGWSFVFWSDVPEQIGMTRAVANHEWWRQVHGADWRNIYGPQTREADWKQDHPVVHISHRDAAAYAKWAGGRLPTEAEWEHAARGGLGDVLFPWGNQEPDETDHHPCNIWQGEFPQRNTVSDGWKSTAPALSFEPNGYGLYNMMGNVWEWTADTYRVKSLKKRVRERVNAMHGFKVLKGGSFLCHKSYCFRYRIAARTGNSPDSTTTHQGFRVVWDI